MMYPLHFLQRFLLSAEVVEGFFCEESFELSVHHVDDSPIFIFEGSMFNLLMASGLKGEGNATLDKTAFDIGHFKRQAQIGSLSTQAQSLFVTINSFVQNRARVHLEK